ncbi:hypothetical protein HHI36_008270 [Cryptolaemus montrouzieri]|uniref:Uncharacterized protein n=1 Tax=Cryptolaemus montrouzieri TaxID=559131 RepID=A0ABD2MSH7_9CUCU
MARWILLIILMVTLIKVQATESAKECKTTKTKIGNGDHLICSNVTSYFFRKFDISLNKTYMITCENCTLTTIDENTFPFRNNHVNILYLVKSGIRILKKLAFARFPSLKILVLRNNTIDNLDTKTFGSIKN